jgi:hypothetical protein
MDESDAESPAMLARGTSSSWFDNAFRSAKRRQHRQNEVQQSDCPFGVLVMGVLLVGLQLVSALLAVISMVRGNATPELWGRLVGSLLGLAIAWGYLSGQKAALRLYQFFGGIQIVGLVAGAMVARGVEPLASFALAVAAIVAVVIYFYNFTPTVESYFRGGAAVRYSYYLTSWHFYVPLSVCVVGIVGGYGAISALRETIELQRWAMQSDPGQVVRITVSRVADRDADELIKSRVRQLVGPTAEMKSEWLPDAQRARIAVAPVADITAFSQRIDFGQVMSTKGRHIEIAADPAAIDALVKAEQQRRAQEAERAKEIAEAKRAEQEQLVEQRRREHEERVAKHKEDRDKWAEEAKERDKKMREVASGPGWVLEHEFGKPGERFIHRKLGYRIAIPVFWELNPAVNSVRTINPSQDRESAFGFAHVHSSTNELKAILRVETYVVEGNEQPLDVVRRWDKLRSSGVTYKRNGPFQELKLGELPTAGMGYSWRDATTDAEFEVWCVRRNERLYVVTIGANRRELNWSFTVKDIRKSLQSFELIDPESNETDGATPSRS